MLDAPAYNILALEPHIWLSEFHGQPADEPDLDEIGHELVLLELVFSGRPQMVSPRIY